MNKIVEFKNIFLDFNFKLILIYILVIFMILLFSEFLLKIKFFKNYKNKITTEIKRKIPHILIGFLFINSIFFLKKEELLFLTILIFIFSAINKKFLIFNSFLEIKRKSFGVVLFPLSIFFLTLFFYEQKNSFIFGLLVLTLGDSFAAIFGKFFGKKKIFKNDNKNQKTHIGSLTFFITTFLLFIFLKKDDFDFNNLFIFENIFLMFWAFLSASFLTILELFLIFGFDNLFLPIFGAFLFSLF